MCARRERGRRPRRRRGRAAPGAGVRGLKAVVYQAQVAHRFRTAPIDSDEKALAGAELSARLAADRGESYQTQGGDARTVIARLRRQQNAVRESAVHETDGV